MILIMKLVSLFFNSTALSLVVKKKKALWNPTALKTKFLFSKDYFASKIVYFGRRLFCFQRPSCYSEKRKLH